MAPESCNLDKDEAEVFKPAASATSSTSSPSPPPPPPTLFLKPPQESPVPRPETPAADARDRAITPTPEKEEERSQPLAAARAGNRCSSCQRRVGLTGFRCRCGDLFCGRHRYSDTHDCSFDYKAAGREQISKANPVIRAAKIIKI